MIVERPEDEGVDEMTTTERTTARRRATENGLTSWAMEGLTFSPDEADAFRAFAHGEIDRDEYLRRLGPVVAGE